MKKKTHSINFNNKKSKDFDLELKREIKEYMKTQKNGNKGNYEIYLKIIVLFTLFFGAWGLLSFTHLTGLGLILALAVFGIAYSSLAFTIGHDSGHGTIFRNTKIDKALFWFTYSVLGIPPYIWNYTHNRIHHPNVNIDGYDMDIDKNPVLRLTPMTPWKSYHRFQHIYCFALYPLFFFNKFFFNDFNALRKIEQRYMGDRKHPIGRIVEHYVMKAVYLFLMIGVPALFSGYSLGAVALTYIVFMMSISVVIGLTLASAHLNEGCLFIDKPENGDVEVSFSELQIKTCIDFSPESRFWGFLCGGINAHVAHHLFPKICSVHYRAITKMIKNKCQKYGIDYREMNIIQLWASHIKYLRHLGQGEGESSSSNKEIIENAAIATH
jgi:linoleoyl-CoA desaturase